MKREWSCLNTEYSYIFKLKYGNKILAKEIPKDTFYHTLDPYRYFEYHIYHLNKELKECILPLTRDLGVAKHIRSEWK